MPYVEYGYWVPGYCEDDPPQAPESLVANQTLSASETIIARQANSPSTAQLGRNTGEYIDPRADPDAFYDPV
jgi:hypothetical protein